MSGGRARDTPCPHGVCGSTTVVRPERVRSRVRVRRRLGDDRHGRRADDADRPDAFRLDRVRGAAAADRVRPSAVTRPREAPGLGALARPDVHGRADPAAAPGSGRDCRGVHPRMDPDARALVHRRLQRRELRRPCAGRPGGLRSHRDGRRGRLDGGSPRGRRHVPRRPVRRARRDAPPGPRGGDPGHDPARLRADRRRPPLDRRARRRAGGNVPEPGRAASRCRSRSPTARSRSRASWRRHGSSRRRASSTCAT